MISPDRDFDSLVDALRADLPSKSDQLRVRRRLLAAGVGVATSMAAPSATASVLGAGASVPAALLQKLGALSWAVKLGLAGVAATAALPAAVYLTSAEESSPVVDVASLTPRVLARAVPPRAVATALPVTEPSVPAEAPALDSMLDSEPLPTSPKPVPRSPDPSGADAPRSAEQASSAAFPTDEGDGARARSTLGEETALVERALYALRRGDRDGARRALEEHARRFPNGLLARERDRALSRANALFDSKSPAPPTTEPIRNP